MIAAQFLNDVAAYVDSRVAKVVLNGSHEITDFEVKAVTDNTLALNYIIPAAEVPHVTKIELKSEDDDLITTNDVNLPISSDTLMLQTISVEEVTL
jgi:hypothetical protein